MKRIDINIDLAKIYVITFLFLQWSDVITVSYWWLLLAFIL